MKLGRLPRVLLALTFLVGQLFASAHATQHDILKHGKQHCETCAFAHASPLPQAQVSPAAQHIPHAAPQPVPVVRVVDRRPFARPNTRGPPHILA